MIGKNQAATVLVADDQVGVRRLLAEVFGLEGYQVLLASSGKEALDIAEDKRPDLILLDMKMPGMGGLETLSSLRRTLPKTPVVIMTAVSDIDVAKAAALGAVCTITKPFDVHELRGLVAHLLSRACEEAAEEPAGYDIDFVVEEESK